ncbi:MAG: type I secretion system permease/ATPase [Gammaproteobacteria bacterium]|nr:type I secretion system permease/ATPase [Gammaproteobacteria bacterium]
MEENSKQIQNQSEGLFDTGLACIVLLARLFELPADPKGLRHQFGRSGLPFDSTDILRAAKEIGLKARLIKSDWVKLQKTQLPCIAISKDGKYSILAKLAEDKILIQHPDQKTPSILKADDFKQWWSGKLILLTRRARLGDSLRKFDISWFIPAIIRYKRFLGEVLLASLFIQLFALITPLFFQVVIDKVLVHKGLTTLDVLAIGLLVVSVFEVTLTGLRTYIFSHTTNRIDVELGSSLFRHLLRLPLSYFEARRVGNLVARVRELDTIRNFITGSGLTLVIDLLFTVVFFVVMYFYSPTLTYIVLGTIPFYVLIAFFVTPILRKRLEEKFQRGAENQAFLIEAINGIETVKAGAVEPQNQRRWEEQLAAYVKAGFRTTNLGNIANQSTSFISKLTVLLILWVGAHKVMAGDLSVGQLIAFNMIAGRVSGPILRLAQLWQDFQQARISVERLGDILNSQPEPAHNPGRGSLPKLEGRIEFEKVTFRYRPDGPEILRNISLGIQPGEVIGIVGRSGSGKSTLTKLVQRLYVPESGRVLVDGVDLAMVEPAWLRRNIGVVLQENFLFNRSVRENIALADPAIPVERVIQAAKLAGAHEFVLELPEGYDSMVGERGSNLSGGQRQRIAIARALITNPRILIFDEATSALDYESERIIQQNMQLICKGRTVIIIAHRLSAVRNANRILVVEKGEIIEQGPHEILLQQDGYYKRLWGMQSK